MILSGLTKNEMDQLRDLAQRWKAAHADKQFGMADALRTDLMDWGAWPPENGWHPVFESSSHRSARLAARMTWPFPPPSDHPIMDRAELERRQDELVREGRAIGQK